MDFKWHDLLKDAGFATKNIEISTFFCLRTVSPLCIRVQQQLRVHIFPELLMSLPLEGGVFGGVQEP